MARNTGDFQISGILVDAESEEPLAHARVAIASISKRDDLSVELTGSDGRFLFTGLTPGKYTLTAQARGHLQQSFNQHDQLSSAIAVGADVVSTDLIFKLPRESSISGTVIDEAGEPVRNASVSLYLVGLSVGLDATRGRGRTITNDQGEYHFSHLNSGQYLVAVSARPWYAQYGAPPFNTPESGNSAVPGQIVIESSKSPLDVAYPVTFYGGSTEAASATTIRLSQGERFTANVALQPLAAMHVRVAVEQNSTDYKYLVLEQHVLGGPALPIQVENRSLPNGGMETIGVPPGHYTMKVLTAGQAYTDNPSAQEVDVSSSGGLERADGSIYASVSAVVAGDAAGIPKQMTVRLQNKKSLETITERVGDQGEVVFKQGILPGSYEVLIFSDGGTYLKTVAAEGAKLAGRTIEIKPGATVKLKIAIARGFGDISGTALRDGKGLAGVMILLVPPDPAHNQVLFRRDQSDSDGTFHIANVVPGNYTMLALENGWELEWTNAAVLRPFMARGIPVIVQPNGKNDLKLTVQ